VHKSLQRFRGTIGMGLTWGAGWAVVGMAPRWLFGFNADVPFPFVFGFLGFVAGVIFSAVLVVAEGRRSLDQMSFPRFAIWGTLGGVLLSAFFVRVASLGAADALAIVPILSLACGISAVGSLALAKRADAMALLETNADGGAAKLTEYKTRKLL
jgi:hypothetical protein